VDGPALVDRIVRLGQERFAVRAALSTTR
jgi:hypothetical protein